MQEEIKITSVTVFVNPYNEPEEEEEEKAKDEKNAEDEENVSFWFLERQATSLFFLLSLSHISNNELDIFFLFRIKLGHGLAIQAREQQVLELLVVVLGGT